MKFKDLLSGFIRLHVLHHAAEHEIYGQWMIDELAQHGYKLSAGTLYPMLHAMEQRGISDPARSGTVARLGRFIGPRRWGARRWRSPRHVCGSLPAKRMKA